jgi:putative CocE/NonD family hydrolase
MSRLAFHLILLASILIGHNGWAEEVQTTIPPRFNSVVVDYDVEIPMRDGVVLFADVYRPRGVDGPISTILVRAPYGKREPYIFLPAQGRFWARRGFAFVAQDVRGKYASARDAEFVHSVHELEDGRDTLEWIAKQPWSNGSVGQMGESYMGYTSLASMASKHPVLKCIAPGMTSTDWSITDYQQGAPALQATGGWLLDLDAEAYQDTGKVNYWDLPLASLGKNAGIKDTMFIEWLRNPRGELAIKADLRPHLEGVEIPILHYAGAYDNILGGSLQFWNMMQRGPAAKDQWLLLGPWDHEMTPETTHRVGRIPIGDRASTSLMDKSYEFFQYCLNGVETEFSRGPRIHFFTIGENRWRQSRAWPPETAKQRELYFDSDGDARTANGTGRLRDRAPADDGADRFVYDPADPVALSTTHSPWTLAQDLPDRKVLEDREDILFYQSAPLKTDLNVTGPIKAVLHASTSAVDTDFTATLVDLHPDGYAHQVQFGIVRASYRDGIDERKLIQPDRIYEYEIDMWATSYLFRKGHRLRVEISSSNFDHYARNLNNGEPVGFSDRIVKAKQTVHHSPRHPSRLVFWVID